MRYQQWRLLLLRSYHRSHLSSTFCSQITSISTRYRSGIGALQQSEQICPLRSPMTTSSGSLLKSVGRSFSSEPEKSSAEAVVIDIFSRLSGDDEIRKELESSDIMISQDLALKVLRKLESNPDVARRFFQWIREDSPGELSSKNYNMMLRILGGNGLVDEFWGLVDEMKKKGHGLSANVRDKVGDKFQKDGLESDFVRLKKLFSSDCLDNSVEKICRRVCKIVMKEEWSDDVEKRVKDLNVEFHSDLVKMIVESLDVEPRKALLFFRWIDESGLFKHDEKTYNAIARVLGKEKFLDRFQNIIGEMRSVGYEVEIETYVKVSTRFCQTNMIKEAVDLFEIAMVGSNKPTQHCLCLLLKKIFTAKTLDMDLFSRAVKAYTRNGNALTDSLLKSLLKSLRSVDRTEQSNEVLKEMKKGGYVPNNDMQSLSLLDFFPPEQVREHIGSLREEVDQQDRHTTSEKFCQLCELGKLTFEPPHIFCFSCERRIKKNEIFFYFRRDKIRFCIRCYEDKEVALPPKSKLKKRKNDQGAEELWVQCDKCEAWQHQICALYHEEMNEAGQVEYICPYCYINEVEQNERKPLPQSALLGAKDLPRTNLSDHIEQRLFTKLKQERTERARVQGTCYDEIPTAESLTVRVIQSLDKKVEVKSLFLELFPEDTFPVEFPYRFKAVVMFQKIEGVDVLLFAMHVQEYGSKCPFPNQRSVYLSLLDSVNYFRPAIKSVYGESLRTYVYHEILIGYLEYCKLRGFTSLYLWSCPPWSGQDYIFHCRPESQKIPERDQLREWYLAMLKKAAKEGIVVKTTNLYDHFFLQTGECRAKITAARIPYFHDDRWPGRAEEILYEEDDVSDLLLMQKFGKEIQEDKEDYIMVQLQHCCSHCCMLMVTGNRWLSSQCKDFQLCDGCYEKLEDKGRHYLYRED